MSGEKILFFSGFAAGGFIGLLLALLIIAQPIKKEAVERGFAEWNVKSNGNTTWKWKESK